MKARWLWLVRLSLTWSSVGIAASVLLRMWSQYEQDPWTRDGRVRADVVSVAPDVAGWVVKVCVVDNQVIRKGDPLFEIDRARFEIAVQQAQAAVAQQRAMLAEAQREAHRNNNLGDVVSSEVREQSDARAQEAAAELQRDLANLSAAQLNLQRTVVVSPVNGMVTNLLLRPGNYMTVGREALAVVDSDSFHVDGYFEETKLPHIHQGDRVSVRLMGESALLYGRVQGVAPAIFDRERTITENRVANINPTFTWVRLAQRVPVRIELDQIPAGVRLVAGRTATVVDLSYAAGEPRSTGTSHSAAAYKSAGGPHSRLAPSAVNGASP